MGCIHEVRGYSPEAVDELTAGIVVSPTELVGDHLCDRPFLGSSELVRPHFEEPEAGTDSVVIAPAVQSGFRFVMDQPPF
jgi:hypothetical protein